MKEYFINKNNKKRRLKIYNGDVIIYYNEEFRSHNSYRIVHEHGFSEYGDSWSLYCLSCCRLIFSGCKSKDELKSHLLKFYNVKKVIGKHELIKIIENNIGLKLIKD